ncbi:MAG: serine hydrolase domain-containing protein [Bacillota bacterium]|nr:serine hydrolase domain-containing protein [Bacillota bacterium]
MIQGEEELKNVVNKYVKSDEPGLSLIIGQDKEILFEGYYGLADLDKCKAIGKDTKFLTASLTKQITCAALLILEERGLVDLETSLLEFFPNFPIFYEKVNIINLMTHTSGIKEYLDDNFFDNTANKYIEKEKVIETISKFDNLDFKPGTKFKYSNSGYVLLGDIIEKITNESFGEFIEENIFDVLNMKNSFILDKNSKNRIDEIACGYKHDSKFKWKKVDLTNDVIGWADGNMVSNIRDLFIWINSLSCEKVINKKLEDRIFKPYILQNGESSDYGLGWFIENDGYYHTGTTSGYISKIHIKKEDGYTVIMLSNNDSIDRDRFFEDIFKFVYKE